MGPVTSPYVDDFPEPKQLDHQRSRSASSKGSPLSKKQRALFENENDNRPRPSRSRSDSNRGHQQDQVPTTRTEYEAREQYLSRHHDCHKPTGSNSQRSVATSQQANQRNSRKGSSRNSLRQSSERGSQGPGFEPGSSSEGSKSAAQNRSRKRGSASSKGSWRENLSRVAQSKDRDIPEQDELRPPTKQEKANFATKLNKNSR